MGYLWQIEAQSNFLLRLPKRQSRSVLRKQVYLSKIQTKNIQSVVRKIRIIRLQNFAVTLNLHNTESIAFLCWLWLHFGFTAWQENKLPLISAVMFNWVTIDDVLPPYRPGLLFRLMLSISMPSLQNVRVGSGLLEPASQMSLPTVPARNTTLSTAPARKSTLSEVSTYIFSGSCLIFNVSGGTETQEKIQHECKINKVPIIYSY